ASELFAALSSAESAPDLPEGPVHGGASGGSEPLTYEQLIDPRNTQRFTGEVHAGDLLDQDNTMTAPSTPAECDEAWGTARHTMQTAVRSGSGWSFPARRPARSRASEVSIPGASSCSRRTRPQT